MVFGFAAIGPDICPVGMQSGAVERGRWIAAHILAAGYLRGTDLAICHLSGAIGSASSSTRWLAAKLTIFAVIVALGLMIRI